MKPPQICIIGGGISGLILGRCLLRHGIQAVLFEKSRPSQNRNRYGITLHATSYRPLLSLLGIDEKLFLSKVAVDAGAAGTGRLTQTENKSSFRANRSRFESLMAEGLDIRHEHQFNSLNTTSRLTLQFSNGFPHETDVLIGADGVHSQLRQIVSPETNFDILPYAVFNGKRRVPREEFDTRLKKHFQGYNLLKSQIDSTVLQISIDDYGQDEISISYNYSRPARSEQDPLYRPTRSKTDATSIPKAFFDEIDATSYEEPFQFVFNSQAIRKDRILNWLTRTLKVEREVLDKAAGQGILFIGEAVHGEPILGSYGANEAIRDGMDLAEILAKGQDLASFYKTRYETWMAGIEASKQRMEIMHSNSKSSL